MSIKQIDVTKISTTVTDSNGNIIFDILTTDKGPDETFKLVDFMGSPLREYFEGVAKIFQDDGARYAYTERNEV